MIRHRLFNFVAGVSLLLCVASAVLWAWSYWTVNTIQITNYRYKNISDGLTVRGDCWSWTFGGTRGDLFLSVYDNYGDFRKDYYDSVLHVLPQFTEAWHLSHESGEPTDLASAIQYVPDVFHNWHVVQFGWREMRPLYMGAWSGMKEWHVAMPLWFLMLLTGAMPTIRVISFVRRRTLASSCKSCGYNLTANTSGTCPECGTPVPSKLETIA